MTTNNISYADAVKVVNSVNNMRTEVVDNVPMVLMRENSEVWQRVRVTNNEPQNNTLAQGSNTSSLLGTNNPVNQTSLSYSDQFPQLSNSSHSISTATQISSNPDTQSTQTSHTVTDLPPNTCNNQNFLPPVSQPTFPNYSQPEYTRDQILFKLLVSLIGLIRHLLPLDQIVGILNTSNSSLTLEDINSIYGQNLHL